MTAIEEITLAIDKLPRSDFWSLTDQLIMRREAQWDQEMMEDARSGGPLDCMAEKALKEFNQGKTCPLP